MDRTALLQSLINVDGIGLEIGPSYNPLMPKAAGFKVEIADYLDAPGLRAKYAGNASVDPGAIETVDYVLDGSKDLATTVGRKAYYDYIVASHVIEHVPDMMGFLEGCESLLKPEGILLLAVPDKRHCFDVLQPLTTTGSVLQAHIEKRNRPTPGAVFDDRAYNAVRDGAIGWSIGSPGQLTFFSDLEDAISAFELAQHPGYIDVHVWRFVPSSFRLLMRDLHEIGRTGLRERTFHPSVGNEFYVTLSKMAEGCPVGRLELARNLMEEHADIRI